VATNLNASDRVCPPLELNRCHRWTSPLLDRPSVPHSGRVQREQEAWQGKTFSLSLTARCVVGKEQRSLRRNAALNTMGQYASSMPPVSLTVEPVPYARSVKDMVPPPRNLVVSVLSCIPCLRSLRKSSRLCAFLPLPLIPFSGGIGHEVLLAEPGSDGNGVTW
jgi:hypothetical protein